MVNLTALLDQIRTSPKFVKLVDPNQDFDFYKFFTVYWTESGVIYSSSICIYIDKRGTPQESAYFKDVVPGILRTPAPTPFADALNAGIAAFMTANPNVEKVEIVRINESQEVAELYAYVNNAGTVTKKTVAVYKIGANLTYRVLA